MSREGHEAVRRDPGQDLDAEALRRRHYNATIASMRRIHEDLLLMRVVPDGALPSFRPGQWATLGLGYWEPPLAGCRAEEPGPDRRTRLVRRAFSISSPVLDPTGHRLVSPEEEGFLEFYIVLVRKGLEEGEPPAFTPRLFLLERGARIWLGPKITGTYTLDPVEPWHDVLFCATGTGEAPHNRMIWHLLRSGHEGRIASVVCCRRREDLAYLEVHRRLEQLYPNYAYLALTTRDAGGPKKYIQDVIASGELEERTGLRLDPERVHVFLCGNPAMIGIPVERGAGTVYPSPKGVIEVLETEKGFRADRRNRPGNIHFEKYW